MYQILCLFQILNYTGLLKCNSKAILITPNKTFLHKNKKSPPTPKGAGGLFSTPEGVGSYARLISPPEYDVKEVNTVTCPIGRIKIAAEERQFSGVSVSHSVPYNNTGNRPTGGSGS